MQPAGQDPELLLAPGTVAVPLRSQPNASSFWIMLLLVSGRLDNGMIRIWQPDTGVAKMPSTDPTPSVTADQLTRALGEAVIRIWSNLPQDVQLHLFQEAVTSHGESIRSQLAVFLHDKHPRTLDPLGRSWEMTEPVKKGRSAP